MPTNLPRHSKAEPKEFISGSTSLFVISENSFFTAPMFPLATKENKKEKTEHYSKYCSKTHILYSSSATTV